MCSRGTPAMLLAGAALLAAAGCPTAADAVAPAGGVALTPDDAGSAIALSGSQVLIQAFRSRGALLRSFSLAGAPSGRVGSVLVPPPSGTGFADEFDASESTVSLVRIGEGADGSDGDGVAYSGSVGSPFQALSPPTTIGRPGSALGVHVSGQATLLQTIGPGQSDTFSVREPGSAPIVLPAFRDEVTDSAIAGDLVAFALHSDPDAVDRSGRRLVVYDWRTHRLVYDRRLPWTIEDVDLAPDGRVAASVDTRGQQLAVVSRAGRPRLLTRQVRASLATPRFSGDRIVALSQLNGRAPGQRVISVSLRSGRIRALGPRTEEVRALDANATTAAWIDGGCVLAAPVAGPRLSSIPPGPCLREEVTLQAPKTRLRRRAAPVDVYCQSSARGSCRGVLRLRSHGNRVLAFHRYAVVAGHHARVSLIVSPREAQRLRRRGSTDLVAATTVRDGYGHSGRVLGVVPLRFPRR